MQRQRVAIKRVGRRYQETRTPVTFFSYFSHYGCSLLSISHYVSPSRTAQQTLFSSPSCVHHGQFFNVGPLTDHRLMRTYPFFTSSPYTMVDLITNSPGHGGLDRPGQLVTMVDPNMAHAQSRLPNTDKHGLCHRLCFTTPHFMIPQ